MSEYLPGARSDLDRLSAPAVQFRLMNPLLAFGGWRTSRGMQGSGNGRDADTVWCAHVQLIHPS
jgi:hypothetical protein